MKSPLAAGALVFFTSAAVLVLEILAGRILAPYVGVTLQTFTGIIGTVLAGIALGSWLGGRAADRGDPNRLLAPLLIGGGLLVVITPTVVTALGPSLSGENPAQIVSLAFVGFFLPAAVLSAVSPVVAKIQLQSLDETGTIVGSLSALGTAGAIFGTFVTGFVLVAALPSRPITWAVGGALVAVGIVLAIRGGAGTTALSALALLALVVASSAAVGGPCDRETAYFCATVQVDPNRPTGRELILDTLRHSYVDLEDPEYLGSQYARAIAAVIETDTAPTENVLYIGGGGFTLPRYFLATEGARATVLELDPTVVEIAEAELALVPGPWLRIETGDARVTLGDTELGSYDAVVGDAFGGPSVPWHLTTEEFLVDIKLRLRPGGVYAMNVIDHPPARFVKAEVATLNAVFGHVAVVAPPELLDGSTGGNFVLVASNAPIDGSAIASAIAARSGREVVIIDAAALDFAAGARVLRDEYAPVDQLLGRP